MNKDNKPSKALIILIILVFLLMARDITLDIEISNGSKIRILGIDYICAPVQKLGANPT